MHKNAHHDSHQCAAEKLCGVCALLAGLLLLRLLVASPTVIADSQHADLHVRSIGEATPAAELKLSCNNLLACCRWCAGVADAAGFADAAYCSGYGALRLEMPR